MNIAHSVESMLERATKCSLTWHSKMTCEHALFSYLLIGARASQFRVGRHKERAC